VVWTGCYWLRQNLAALSSEDSSEPSVSMKCGEFLDQLSECLAVK
jgi:hypothetical protein